YERLPKAARAQLHERLALWLARCGTELVALDELLGHHLEQAYRYGAALGARDSELARRAACHLRAAGLRAHHRGDARAAANLLGRASLISPADAPARLELLLPYAYALNESGRVHEAQATRAELHELATAIGDRRLAALARSASLAEEVYVDPDADLEQA